MMHPRWMINNSGLMNVINDHHDNLQNPKERLFDKDWLESISAF